MRTTSPLESFNSVIGRSIPKHPNIFRFIEYMKLHEFNIMLNMWKLPELDEPDTAHRKLDRERDEKIKYATEMLKLNQITIEDFLGAVSIENMIPNKGLFKVFARALTQRSRFQKTSLDLNFNCSIHYTDSYRFQMI